MILRRDFDSTDLGKYTWFRFYIYDDEDYAVIRVGYSDVDNVGSVNWDDVGTMCSPGAAVSIMKYFVESGYKEVSLKD